MRLTAVNLFLVAGLLGCVGGWTLRQEVGLSGSRAGVIAETWLMETMGYADVRIVARQRFATLEGYSGPVYGISARASGEYRGLPSSACWGVVIDVRTEQVLGGVGGEIPWLKCI